MSIEDKIEFWGKVMAYGKQRNVKFYVIIWNIFVYVLESRSFSKSTRNNGTALRPEESRI